MVLTRAVFEQPAPAAIFNALIDVIEGRSAETISPNALPAGTATGPGAAYAPRWNVHTFGALGNLHTVFDAAMTSGSAIMTSATAGFTSSDPGKVVHLPGAGASGATLVGTIIGYTSPTQVTLSVTAGTTVSGAPLAYGTADDAARDLAMAAAWLFGGEVEFAALGYMFNAPCVLPTGDADTPLPTDRRLTFRGQGASWTYGYYQQGVHNRAYGTRLFYARTDGSDMFAAISGTGHCRPIYRFVGLTLIGPDIPPNASGVGGTKTSGNGIRVSGQNVAIVQTDDVEIVQFLGATKSGMWLDNVENYLLRDTRWLSNDYGLSLTGNANAGTIINPQFQLNVTRGFSVLNASTVAVVGGVVQSNIGAGLYATGLVGAEFLATHFENNNTALTSNVYGAMLVGTSGNYNEHVRFRSCRFSGTSQKDTIYLAGVSGGGTVYVTVDGGYCGINGPTPAVIADDIYVHDVTVNNFVPYSRMTDNSGDGIRGRFAGQEFFNNGTAATPPLALGPSQNAGIFWDAVNSALAFAIGGVRAGEIGASGVSFGSTWPLTLGTDAGGSTSLLVYSAIAGMYAVLTGNNLDFHRPGTSNITQQGAGGALAISTQNTAANALIQRLLIGSGDTAPITVTGTTSVVGSLTATSIDATKLSGAAPSGLTGIADVNVAAAAAISESKLSLGRATPEDHGFLAWNGDPGTDALNNGTLNAGAGILHVARVKLPQSKVYTIGHLWVYLVTGGTGLTSGQCFAALYTSAGSLLAATADQATAWAGTGPLSMALSSSQTITGGSGVYCWVVLYYNGTTSPAFATFAGSNSVANINLNGASVRWGTVGSGFTTAMPASFTPASLAVWTRTLFAALS